MSFTATLDEHFSAPTPNGDFSFLAALKKLHPDPQTQHVALSDLAFPLSAFLRAHNIEVEISDEPRHELVAWNQRGVNKHDIGFQGLAAIINPWGVESSHDRGKLYSRLLTGVMKFTYKDSDFFVYKITWYQDHSQHSLYDVVFNNPEDTPAPKDTDDPSTKTVGHKLISDVYRWSQALKDEIWVFQDGRWAKDAVLWKSVSGSSWGDIVLEEEFLEGLRRDTRTFFENRSIYHELGVVWKRGLLLLGPPGNGKTETIKVLLKESGQTALYVKSFTTPMGPENGVRSIFDHARANAPCILVIEDLDSLVTPNVRSFFLNELDGLSQNEGILTIATTNHPERIDDAILNRPSRFDVKYDFALPSESLRSAYALKWIQKINSLSMAAESSNGEARVRFDKDETELASDVAKNTEGWSFAFLKELFVSFLLRVAHDKSRQLSARRASHAPTSTEEVLMEQISSLSSQILKSDDKSDGAAGGDSAAFIPGNAGFSMPAMRASRILRTRPATAHPGANF
ncbi:hypothetical protein M0805_002413 [Coniferiporia weirii]|nr:hypothetical protein M0805_002413 [Coniferiporia weirii]